ncbi:SDR family NAD(P)-dependent oxidoreductase [Dyadobacter tibetensis]|uniref:SDR family NAD(P)-dependent oxidoreductase n=1 Tax=Dyadobacter tibetensis TaxID=1211851 RepID=UPI0004729A81|nr:SDR family oxidoreductase [Dyadobacter tibetensis]
MKNYLIIGASSGIGKKLATQLTETGHSVWGTYFSNEPLSKDETAIQYHYLDVLSEEMDFGFLPDVLDGVAYCPGKIVLKPFSRVKPQEFLNDYSLQVSGAVKCIQAVLPKLKKAESGAIILFSTVAVQTGFGYHSIVSASKGAIEGLARALAAELAPQIRVNCIAPSVTDTPLASQLLSTEEKRNANAARHPLKRIGTTSDIAHLAQFLLGDESGWITGQIIPVDGGMGSLR